ncbi:MAG: hypothetical protein GF329_21030 [Candidatus Lokiarchaeota archaeon]|nr:hypothetical protein [Candidatus Lokiarchaeota archaeon]
MVKKKWLSFRGTGSGLQVIEEKDDEWGSVTQKSSELVEDESGDYYSIKITYKMPGIFKQDRKIKDNLFSQIEIPNAGQMLQSPGSPQIPQEGLFVALPDDAEDIEVEVINSISKEYEMHNDILPVPEPTRDAPPEMKKDETYEKDKYYPGTLFKNLGERKIGEVNALQIMVYPVQYNPKSRKIDVYSEIQLEVRYKIQKSKFRGGFRSTPGSGSKKKRVPKMYKDQILNLRNVM